MRPLRHLGEDVARLGGGGDFLAVKEDAVGHALLALPAQGDGGRRPLLARLHGNLARLHLDGLAVHGKVNLRAGGVGCGVNGGEGEAVLLIRQLQLVAGGRPAVEHLAAVHQVIGDQLVSVTTPGDGGEARFLVGHDGFQFGDGGRGVKAEGAAVGGKGAVRADLRQLVTVVAIVHDQRVGGIVTSPDRLAVNAEGVDRALLALPADGNSRLAGSGLAHLHGGHERLVVGRDGAADKITLLRGAIAGIVQSADGVAVPACCQRQGAVQVPLGEDNLAVHHHLILVGPGAAPTEHHVVLAPHGDNRRLGHLQGGRSGVEAEAATLDAAAQPVRARGRQLVAVLAVGKCCGVRGVLPFVDLLAVDGQHIVGFPIADPAEGDGGLALAHLLLLRFQQLGLGHSGVQPEFLALHRHGIARPVGRLHGIGMLAIGELQRHRAFRPGVDLLPINGHDVLAAFVAGPAQRHSRPVRRRRQHGLVEVELRRERIFAGRGFGQDVAKRDIRLREANNAGLDFRQVGRAPVVTGQVDRHALRNLDGDGREVAAVDDDAATGKEVQPGEFVSKGGALR